MTHPFTLLQKQLTPSLPLTIYGLFLPAELGLLGQVIGGIGGKGSVIANWPVILLALGTLLICLEQARMAIVDLQQIKATQQRVQDPRLDHFHTVTLSTIVIELVGFYVAAIWVGWGALIFLLSQIWFNLLAKIQLHPATATPIQAYGVRDRIPVLLADGIGLCLVGLWLADIASLWDAGALLSIALIYGWVKYVQPNLPS